jgi:hypothetical protein
VSLSSATAIVALACLAVLATGCGGSSGNHVAQLGSTATTSNSKTSAASAQGNGAVAFSRCMRAHGVSNMPDPDSRGHLDIGPDSGVAVNSPRFQDAYQICKSKLSP